MTRFMEDISKRALQNNTVVGAVPIANPEGYELNQRENVRGVDLNRNFNCLWEFKPGGKHGQKAFSERESQVLGELIKQLEPDVIVNIHWALSYIEADSPNANSTVFEMWRSLPADDKPLYRTLMGNSNLDLRPDKDIKGSLGMWAGYTLNFNKFRSPKVITLELPYDPFLKKMPYEIPNDHLQITQRLWNTDAKGYLERVYPGFYKMMLCCLKG